MSWDMSFLGEMSLKKDDKFWDSVPNIVDPDIWDIFEFQTLLKNADPPIGSNSDIFGIQTILMPAAPPPLPRTQDYK